MVKKIIFEKIAILITHESSSETLLLHFCSLDEGRRLFEITKKSPRMWVPTHILYKLKTL